jgi:hypothetical protein
MKKKIINFLFLLSILFIFFIKVYPFEKNVTLIVTNYDFIKEQYKFKPYYILYDENTDLYHSIFIEKKKLVELKDLLNGEQLILINKNNIGVKIESYDLEKFKKLFTKNISNNYFPFLNYFLSKTVEYLVYLYSFYKSNNFNYIFYLGINNYEVIKDKQKYFSFFQYKNESDIMIFLENYFLNSIIKKNDFFYLFKDKDLNYIYNNILNLSTKASFEIKNFIDRNKYDSDFFLLNIKNDINVYFITDWFIKVNLTNILKNKKIDYNELKLLNYFLK